MLVLRSASVGSVRSKYHTLRLNTAELRGGKVRHDDDLLAYKILGLIPLSYARYHLPAAESIIEL